MSPPLVEMVVAPGGDRSFFVTLTNEGERTYTTRVQIVDLTLDKDGNPVPQAAGSGPWSLSTWLTVTPEQVTLEPHREAQVKCRVRAPRGEQGGRYGALLFSADRPGVLGQQGMHLSARVGTVLLVTLAHTERRAAEVRAARAEEGRHGVQLVAEAANTGNVHVRLTGEAVVRDARRRVLARVKLHGGTGTVLPGEVRDFRGVWAPRQAVEAGCQVEFRFTAPEMPPATAEAEVHLSSQRAQRRHRERRANGCREGRSFSGLSVVKRCAFTSDYI